jgi:hypothetical protein
MHLANHCFGKKLAQLHMTHPSFEATADAESCSLIYRDLGRLKQAQWLV